MLRGGLHIILFSVTPNTPFGSPSCSAEGAEEAIELGVELGLRKNQETPINQKSPRRAIIGKTKTMKYYYSVLQKYIHGFFYASIFLLFLLIFQ